MLGRLQKRHDARAEGGEIFLLNLGGIMSQKISVMLVTFRYLLPVHPGRCLFRI